MSPYRKRSNRSVSMGLFREFLIFCTSRNIIQVVEPGRLSGRAASQEHFSLTFYTESILGNGRAFAEVPVKKHPIGIRLFVRWVLIRFLDLPKVHRVETISRPPTTALRASGSKYLGINSRSNSSVANSASESFRMQGLPADRAATAGRNDNKSGPLNGQMISVTPYGSRYTIPVCPDAARNFGRGASTGFIHSFSCDFANSLVAIGRRDLEDILLGAVLKSLHDASAKRS